MVIDLRVEIDGVGFEDLKKKIEEAFKDKRIYEISLLNVD